MSLKPIHLFFGCLLFVGCSKEDPVNQEPIVQPAATPLHSFNYAAGVLYLDQYAEPVYTPTDTVMVTHYEAFAYFLSDDKTGLVEAGKVLLDSIQLEYTDKIYYKNGFQFPAGYSVGSTIQWRVTDKEDLLKESIKTHNQLPSLFNFKEEHPANTALQINIADMPIGADSVMISILNDDHKVFVKGDSSLYYYRFSKHDLKKFAGKEAEVEVVFISQKNINKKGKTYVLMHRRIHRESIFFEEYS